MVVVYSLLSLLPLLLFLSLLIIDTANSRGESDTTQSALNEHEYHLMARLMAETVKEGY